ncbi:uncharacterized protein NDAI_0E03110 [Naumovozyma dairenensis CBS 421]|uniref:Uncharacterized protein n=1 Tax=Naumovozyma dairenensis (strain ATCC 10597 / BCRC 20456 / CBS 421 / NBRC 0211 / NRRL Y-12639) TaxID=1071378 RepID=G0WBK8_NAUDC|nr:hypothetical protein NDAI_0E03110 [Naumovozyma dairenensis CBS 421]CCD25128.1 hypothetical protein NDAI_0E03110 [Naumovozyma dairenensis CBS 421]
MIDNLSDPRSSSTSPIRTISDDLIHNPKRLRNIKLQVGTLNNFLISNFSKTIISKYGILLIDPLNMDMSHIHLTAAHHTKITTFFVTMLKRTRSSRLQFKKICCIVLKFLDCCTKEANYMKFLKYNLQKLIVASFVLSVPNVEGDEATRIQRREACYDLFARMTGLSKMDIINCCSIVRSIIIRRSRQQMKATNSSFHMNQHILNSFSRDSPTRDMFHNEVSPFPHHHEPQMSDPPAHINPRQLSSSSSSSSVSYINSACGSEEGNDDETYGSNGYILSAELEQFNLTGKTLVYENFRII